MLVKSEFTPATMGLVRYSGRFIVLGEDNQNRSNVKSLTMSRVEMNMVFRWKRRLWGRVSTIMHRRWKRRLPYAFTRKRYGRGNGFIMYSVNVKYTGLQKKNSRTHSRGSPSRRRAWRDKGVSPRPPSRRYESSIAVLKSILLSLQSSWRNILATHKERGSNKIQTHTRQNELYYPYYSSTDNTTVRNTCERKLWTENHVRATSSYTVGRANLWGGIGQGPALIKECQILKLFFIFCKNINIIYPSKYISLTKFCSKHL